MVSVSNAQRAVSSFSALARGDRKRLLVASARGDLYHLLLLSPAILLLVFFFIFPLMRGLDQSFGGSGDFTLRFYEKALTNGFYQSLWRITFEESATTTLVSLLLGYPVAYFLATSSGRRRLVVFMAVIIPFLTHFVAQTTVWRIILGRRGWVNEILTGIGIIDEPLEILWTRFAVDVGMVQTFLPLMVLCIYAGMLGIPRHLTMVAEGLGATRLRAFRRVYLPLSMPGVWAGVILVFVLSVGSFAAPDILGNIQHRGIASSLRGGGGFNSALAMILLAGIVILYFLFVRFIGFRPLYRAGESLIRSEPHATGGAPKRRFALGIMVTLVSLYLLLPVLLVIIFSFNNTGFIWFPPRNFTLKWYSDFFSNDDPLVDWVGSTVTSLEIATVVAILAVLLGVLVSYSLVRGRYPGKPVITTLMISPLVIPTVVIAGAMFHLYFYNDYMRVLMGTLPGFVLPHTVQALPYVVIILTATLRSVDETRERAAMSLGANRLTTFRRIMLPQMYPGLAIAGFLAFLVSFNEVVLALSLKTRSFQTLPMNIWRGRVAEYAPMMSAVSTVVLVMALALLVGVLLLRRQYSRRAG